MRDLTTYQIKELAENNGYKYAAIKAIIEVESGGVGFAPDGRIIIQFEPTWFKRKAPYTPSGLWSLNKVEKQAKEWAAFNDAFSKNPNAAMESTSIGMMQVMGFHYKRLGFATVGEMWDYAKKSEANQVDLAIRFIKSHPRLDRALKTLTWRAVAFYYNGEDYEKYEYHKKLERAYFKYAQHSYTPLKDIP